MVLKLSFFIAAIVLGVSSSHAHSPPDHARVFFVGIKDGDTVTSPVKVKFGIKGFGIAPAGTRGKIKHTTGHFHLLLNMERLPDMDEPLPHSSGIMHFDKGETDAELELAPGRHTLQLLLGDEEHEPHEPPLISKKITVTVTNK